MSTIRRALIPLFLLVPLACFGQDWKPSDNPLFTKWGKSLDPQRVWQEYPRPQMVRKQWLNLNGMWDLALASRRAPTFNFDQRILVPFPVESALSGVKGKVDSDTVIHYRRTFEIPSDWTSKRVLLHFEAVDWEASVSVNGKAVGIHRGGYDPFTFDITPQLKGSGPQELQVDVTDPTDTGTQPRGKQVLNPQGIFYTSTSGIWQTVWLEPVAEHHIKGLEIQTSAFPAEAHVKVDGVDGDFQLKASAADGERVVAEAVSSGGRELVLHVPHPRLWSPHSAFLYRLHIQMVRRGDRAPVDEVESYFGLRTIKVERDHGMPRLFLNGKPEFMFGTLDQGFWPDGIYTPPSDQAIQQDLFGLKTLGFNTVRKHVKVEPDRWYYWCDKLGLIVWQDMPSGDKSIGPNDPDITRTPSSAEDFEKELKAMIDHLRNHPSILMWVLFNEGWGQYDTARLTKWIKDYDPSRLVDSVTGWADRGVGDVVDMHSYPGPDMPKTENTRAAVLGEFGGLGQPVEGHLWSPKGWSYRGFKSQEELTDGFVGLMKNLRPLQAKGLCAAIYTQTTDCETELNGLWTYDREIQKIDSAKARPAIMSLYQPPPQIVAIVPTSEVQGYNWHYTTYEPETDWMQTSYDDSKWASGLAGFGTKGTPGAVVRTKWDQSDIWIRRTFYVPAKVGWHAPNLLIHHDDDAEVYIDGVKAVALPGYVTSYTLVPLDPKLLMVGKHTLAIHCHQISGGQYIDAGMVDVIEPQSSDRVVAGVHSDRN